MALSARSQGGTWHSPSQRCKGLPSEGTLVTLSSDPVSPHRLAVGRAHLGTPERALWSQAQPQLVGKPPAPSPAYFHHC